MKKMKKKASRKPSSQLVDAKGTKILTDWYNDRKGSQIESFGPEGGNDAYDDSEDSSPYVTGFSYRPEDNGTPTIELKESVMMLGELNKPKEE